MEAIIQDLSNTLNISVEVAQELYPEIKQQLIIYSTTNTAISAVFILLFLSIILTVTLSITFAIAGSVIYIENRKNWEDKAFKTLQKKLIISYGVSILLTIAVFALRTIQTIYAADLLLMIQT